MRMIGIEDSRFGSYFASEYRRFTGEENLQETDVPTESAFRSIFDER